MSCPVCAGYAVSYCPCCSPDPIMEECPECHGTGAIYYAFDIDNRTFTEVKELTYNMLPANEDEAEARGQHYIKSEVETCERCEGAGQVEAEIMDEW